MAQPISNEIAMPAGAMPELSRVTATRDAVTMVASSVHGRRPRTRETVTNAIRPPRIGAVVALFGFVDPARAVSIRGELISAMTNVMTLSTTMATSSARSASKSCRTLRRMIRFTAIAMGRPRVPRPAMMFSVRTRNPGSRDAPAEMSSSSPAVVLVAPQPTRKVAVTRMTASMKRTRSPGRRRRLGTTPSSMTTVSTLTR